MKFRNKAADRTVYGLLVASGEDFDVAAVAPAVGLSADQIAAGLVLQCRDDGAWEPSDDEAKAALDSTLNPSEDKPKRSRTASTPKE